MSNNSEPENLNEVLRQAAVLLGANPPEPGAPIRTAAPRSVDPRTTEPAPRPQINRNPVTDWWRNSELWQQLFQYAVKLSVFTICFGFCGFMSRETARHGILAHVLGALLNPIPLALAIGTLGVVALVRRQFGLMTLAQQLLVAHLIATQIV